MAMSARDHGLRPGMDGSARNSWLECDPADYPESPYPGSRAPGSWLLTPEGRLHGLDAVDHGWVDRLTGEEVNIAARQLVLGYGSNLNPVKLAGKFHGERVIVLEAVITGWAAAWCDARRLSGDVVATIVEAPGITEVHAVVAVTGQQLKKMDAWEGHPNFYERRQFAGNVELERGYVVEPLVYVGTERRRPVLQIDGKVALCRNVPYGAVDMIVRKAR